MVMSLYYLYGYDFILFVWLCLYIICMVMSLYYLYGNVFILFVW